MKRALPLSAFALLSLPLMLDGPGSSRLDPAAAERKADHWPEITSSEKALTRIEQDPQADVVILNNERHGKILLRAEDWVNVQQYHWRAKILTDAWKKRGNEISIRGGKYSRVSNIQARTVKPDGSVVSVPSDRIFEKKTVVGTNMKYSEWVFSFPAVEPGAILEYRYDRHDDFLLFIDPFYFEGNGFTRRAHVTQAMPEEMGYQILCSRCPETAKPTIKPWREGPAKGKIYELTLTDLRGYGYEPFMPPRREISPRLEMVLQTWKDMYLEQLGRQDRLLIDWASVAQYVQYNYDAAIKEGQSALRTTVLGWVEGLSDPSEKLKAIVRHVREDFRYVPWENVIGRSRTIAELLKDASADNEEKAVLLWAALKSAGIDSQLALVSGKHVGSLNPQFCSLSQFTHVVTALPKPDGSYDWIDPTIAHAPPAFMPWSDAGAKALLIKKDGGVLVDLPAAKDVSRTSYEVTVKPGEAGAAALEIVAEYAGQDAVDMRRELVPAAEDARQDFFQRWLRSRQSSASLSSYTIENLEAFEEPLKVRMQASAAGIVTSTEEAVLVRGCIVSALDINPVAREAREHSLYLEEGWNIQETVVIEPPPGMKAAEMPAATELNSGAARMSFRCTPSGEGVRCLRVFAAPRKQWPAATILKLKQMYDRIVQSDQTMLVFQPAQPSEGQ